MKRSESITQDLTHSDKLFVAERSCHGIRGVVEGIFPRVKQEHEPELPGCVFLQSLLDGDEILQRLGHLTALDFQMAGV